MERWDPWSTRPVRIIEILRDPSLQEDEIESDDLVERAVPPITGTPLDAPEDWWPPGTRWAIHWVIRSNGQRGQGEAIFNSKAEADADAVEANRKWPHIHHWAEPVSEGQDLGSSSHMGPDAPLSTVLSTPGPAGPRSADAEKLR
jgi:hypothetical protein